MKFLPFLIAITLTAISLSVSARNQKWLEERTNDNMSMMQYAEENHRKLSSKAKSVSVDPDYSSWQSLWKYKMPDGKVIRCTRGIISDIFMYECKER